MATTAAAAEADDAKKQAHDDAAVGSISHILRTLFRGSTRKRTLQKRPGPTGRRPQHVSPTK